MCNDSHIWCISFANETLVARNVFKKYLTISADSQSVWRYSLLGNAFLKAFSHLIVLSSEPLKITCRHSLKSFTEFFSVKNSGLKTKFIPGYKLLIFSHVPGTTVDFSTTIELFVYSAISAITPKMIDKSHSPLSYIGVGSATKIKSHLVQISFKLLQLAFVTSLS